MSGFLSLMWVDTCASGFLWTLNKGRPPRTHVLCVGNVYQCLTHLEGCGLNNIPYMEQLDNPGLLLLLRLAALRFAPLLLAASAAWQRDGVGHFSTPTGLYETWGMPSHFGTPNVVVDWQVILRGQPLMPQSLNWSSCPFLITSQTNGTSNLSFPVMQGLAYL